MNPPEPEAELDPVIHPVNRLRICAALTSAGAVDSLGSQRQMRFAALRDLVGLSDATLSKQLGVLESHGYVSRHREYGSSRARDTVWVVLTSAGNTALRTHLHALRTIAGPAED